ncbi:MAG: serine/threonine-protein phosphatase [Clostridia bacterium]|nr:serine/threonine-protein phosphatase [Clostridia bacterium]
MKIECVVHTDKGKVRSENEDNFFVKNKYLKGESDFKNSFYIKTPCWLAVFDGMGGESAGKEASFVSAKALNDFTKFFKRKDVDDFIDYANCRVKEFEEKNRCKSGSTCALAYIEKTGDIVFANVGDSRIYGFDGISLTQLSVDHTQAQLLLDAGIFTAEQAAGSSQKHSLIQFLGVNSEYKIKAHKLKVKCKDFKSFLLCSDGLTDMLTDAEIADIMRGKALNDAAEELMRCSLNKGGRDNITIVLFKSLD